MGTKEKECLEENKYIAAKDLADDLFRFVEEYYCGKAERCAGGFTLCDINGKTYEVLVKERA